MPTNGTIIGNTIKADRSYGFKQEVENSLENYSREGTNAACDMFAILTSPTKKSDFIGSLMESVIENPDLSKDFAVDDPFYSTYSERLEQLIDNSAKQMVRESVITGYAPIVSYTPYLIKKQWVSCVWKDVFMAEVSDSPILNYEFEKRYIKDREGNLYPMPDVFYDTETMNSLYSKATGTPLKEDPIALPIKKLNLIDPTKNTDTSTTYIADGFTLRDPMNTLTPDLKIFKVIMEDSEHKTHEVLTNVYIDIPTHSFVNGKISYAVKDEDGNVKETLTDELVGNVNFDTGEITVIAVNDTIKKICLKGKTANRFNHNSLDVVRKTEKLQFLVPESGPRLNTPITVEEAADAIALAKIDMFADNVDMMGTVLANFQDNEIRSFAEASFAAQKQQPAKIDAIDLTVVESGFNTIPHGHYTSTVRDYIADAKEYFERAVEKMKYKLQTDQAVIMCVCHPTLVRYIKGDIKWVFSDQTDISGIKISYKMGIAISDGGDRIHVITSSYMKDSEGIRMFLIPTTTELITFKHIMHSIIVDRGYRSPVEPLVPNVMSTQRTLTFEVLPVQGVFTIDGRELYPEAKPVEILNVTPDKTGASAPGVGG